MLHNKIHRIVRAKYPSQGKTFGNKDNAKYKL